MFYVCNYNKKSQAIYILKNINGPFDKKALNLSFIKKELTLRVTR